jgi:acyl-coenzyme A synthetase/AMP-(fatty) acid ligase
MSLVPLSEILGDARPGTQIVALRDGAPISLARLRGETVHNAQRLGALGLRRALLLCEDGYCFIVGLLSLLRIGADIVLPPNLQIGTIAALADSFDAIVTDRAPADCGARALTIEPAEPSERPLSLDPSRSHIDFFTSGSTGAVKRIEKNAALLEREAAMLERAWGERLGDDSVIFGTVSHQHIFGLAFRIIWPLLAGRRFDGSVYFAWETLMAALSGGAGIISSPAHLTRLGGLSPLPEALRPRLVFTAGAPLPATAAAECATIFGQPPLEIFGSTETGAFAWRSGSKPSPWRPLPGVEVSRSDAGLLRVRSPGVAGASWCELADRIALAADGGFHFEGRADRIVKVEGKRVSLRRLEQDLLALPWVAGAAVMPVTAGRLILGGVVALSPSGEAELARLGKFRFERALRRALAATQESAALPRRWRFVAQLPIDGMGKRRSADILALLEASA